LGGNKNKRKQKEKRQTGKRNKKRKKKGDKGKRVLSEKRLIGGIKYPTEGGRWEMIKFQNIYPCQIEQANKQPFHTAVIFSTKFSSFISSAISG